MVVEVSEKLSTVINNEAKEIVIIEYVKGAVRKIE